MRPIAKVAMAMLTATVTLTLFIGQASARNISQSEQGFEAIWASLEFTGAFGTTRCAITLLGEFHNRTFAKVARALVGLIRHTDPPRLQERCTNGTARVLTETLPWHLTYEGFTGTLPNITSVTYLVLRAAFSIREPAFGVTCLGATSSTNPARMTATRNTSTRAITSVTIRGTFPTSCGANVTLSSPPGPFKNLLMTSDILVTLI